MLRIRDEQVLTLRESLTHDMEDELFGDVRSYFEERCTFLGEAQTRTAVRLGIERAGAYGFASKRGLAMYVTLMFVLGGHFDENPLYPWARKNLVDDRHLVETTRSHRFYNALRRYLRAVREENREYLEPIMRYPETPILPSSHAAAGATLEEHLVEVLGTIAPRHFQDAGEAAVRALVRVAVERAASRGITSAAGLSIYVPLTFLLGTGFDQDPQFPWAIEAVAPRNGDAPDTAALRLHESALVWKRHASTFVAKPPAQRG